MKRCTLQKLVFRTNLLPHVDLGRYCQYPALSLSSYLCNTTIAVVNASSIAWNNYTYENSATSNAIYTIHLLCPALLGYWSLPCLYCQVQTFSTFITCRDPLESYSIGSSYHTLCRQLVVAQTAHNARLSSVVLTQNTNNGTFPFRKYATLAQTSTELQRRGGEPRGGGVCILSPSLGGSGQQRSLSWHDN